ncbi:hypothetical protein A6E05_19210 [Aliivibrio sp. 1S165]|nr:hypothetical protein A6E05_19210 [Aliivibrio sp. 1S165]OCH28877.1 hypothetical protein A6E06_19405 [Aliivibrio sp. 1S175]
MEMWLDLVDKYGVEEWASCDMEANGWKLLLRCRTNDIIGNCMVIATIRLDEELQHQGRLKSLLNYLSDVTPWSTIAIEQIENKDLIVFCEKYNFKQISTKFSDSFRIEKDKLIRFDVDEFKVYL